MDKLVVEGGKPLSGSLRVSGAKNASLPIIFSTILLEDSVRLTNVPRLRDLNTSVAMLKVLGCEAAFTDEKSNTVDISVGSLQPEAPYELVKTMRASILVLGPLLAKLGKAKVALPGGCTLGARPIELHLKGLEKMGARFELESGYVIGECDRLKGAEINLDFPSVGATENLISAAVLADGNTIIRNVAREPEITDMVNFLNACGAKIKGQGTDTISVEGVSSLHGEPYRIMPDRLEAGTFIMATAITGGECNIIGCPVEELTAVMAKLGEMGISLEPHGDGVRVSRNGPIRPSRITTRPYPGFPTDLQAPIMALMTMAEGSSTVEETIFENRYMHVPELNRMGANIQVSGTVAVIEGVKELTGAPVMSSDIRAGAALVVASLAAKGETHIQRVYHLDRGHERIEERLQEAGAKIYRTKA